LLKNVIPDGDGRVRGNLVMGGHGFREETTKRLLIELGARGSEKDDDLWGLLDYHPLENLER
jgi:hypothetical protein